MRVPILRRWTQLPDRHIGRGEHKGPDWYKAGLLNTLLALRPRVCLEIGTYMGGTAQVFWWYFKTHQPDGLLVTTDIAFYRMLDMEGVRQVKVYPHSLDVLERHDVVELEMLDGAARKVEQSVDANIGILRGELDKAEATAFDFAFVDGDHTREAMLKDLAIAERLTAPPHYILLDDTLEELHESAATYRDVIVPEWEHYDFEDWPVTVGMGLVWRA